MAQSTAYTSAFFAGNVRSSTPSARKALGRLFDVYQPQSVVDFGCGSGAWLAAAEALGATTLRGFDGPWVDPRELTSRVIDFTPLDFEQTLPEPERSFDLAISVEVAEHLAEDTAAALLRRLAATSDVIVFSAAVPYQGGTHHINEHPQTYWIDIFRAEGFEVFDIFRAALWREDDVKWWFKQNLLLFVREGSDVIDRERLLALEGPLVDVIHPENFVRKITLNKQRIRELEKTVRDLESASAPACSCSEQLTEIRSELGLLTAQVSQLASRADSSSGADAVKELERVARGLRRRIRSLPGRLRS